MKRTIRLHSRIPPLCTGRRSRERNLGERHRRSGNLLVSLLVTMLVLIGIASYVIWSGTMNPIDGDRKPLVIHTAAGTRAAVEAVIREYEEEYGVTIHPQYAGSSLLLNQLQANKFDTADLYLAADDFYTEKAVDLGLAREVIPIAYQRPIAAVRKDSELTISSLEDLFEGNISISMADPEQAAVGRAIRRVLQEIPWKDEASAWDRLQEQVETHGVFKPTVNEVANDVSIGAVDVGLVWDATVAMPNYRDELKPVTLPRLAEDRHQINVAVLNSSEQPTEALRFARFLAARDRGLKSFREYGMEPVDGDEWQQKPELTFFCGAVNRLSMEAILEEFCDREGCTINTNYDGCGILTSRMTTIDDQKTEQGFPDIYMACDRYYLDTVESWFQDDVDVSETELVIVVPKGSDQVKELKDLVKPGIRIAIGEPSQCTVGALSKRLLQSEDLFEALKEKKANRSEIVAEKSSSALLIPDVITGNVDAAIAYLSDVRSNPDEVDFLRIESKLNRAIQPFSIAKTSRHKHLARRLLDHIARSEKRFVAAGFEFRLGGIDGSAIEPVEPVK